MKQPIDPVESPWFLMIVAVLMAILVFLITHA